MAGIKTLTDNKCRIAKPVAKSVKLFDGHGLYLFVSPSGSKIWRMAYRVDKKEQTATIGPYPLVGLADARLKRDELRRKMLDGEEKYVYARRIRLWTSMVLGWAMAQGYCDTNVAAEINPKTAFGRKKVKHFAAVKLREMPALMARIGLEKELQSVLAFKMMAYTWVRTKELRLMRWTDIAGDLWRVPESVMKKDREHLVPLSRQAMATLEKLRLRSRGSPNVFPGDRRLDRPMSENAVLYLLGRIGYGGLMTGHGLRTIASTWGNEHGYSPDAIEMALSHSADSRDAVRSAYNQAEYLPQRRQMLQDFFNWLEFKDQPVQLGVWAAEGISPMSNCGD